MSFFFKKYTILNKIILENTSKKYIKEWVFRDLSYTFTNDNSYVILGLNGSGKSTLLQVVATVLTASKGSVIYLTNDNILESEKIYKHISIASPYMELPEEFTLTEVVDFHLKLKSFYGDISRDQFLETCYLEQWKNKVVRNFSSGMKQRLKLALAIITKSDALFLDEPSANLDRKGIAWYKDLIIKYKQDRIVVVCSNNISDEFFFCNKQINIEDYKNKKSGN